MVYRRTPARIEAEQRKRESIVRATLDLIGEAGWTAATVAAVAARAQIATGALYTHFAGKDELHAEAFDTAAGREYALLADTLRTGEGTPVQRLRVGIQTYARRALKAPGLAYALSSEPTSQSVAVLRLSARRSIRALFAESLSAAMRAGEIPEQDVDLTAGAVVGLLGEALMGPGSVVDERPGRRLDPAATERLIEQLATVALRAAGSTVADHA